jgi:hypothetical protein
MDEFNASEVEAEIREAFDRYEAALVGNDVEALIAFFWDNPRAVRLGAEGSLYGFEEIAAFRRSRDAGDVKRELLWVEIRALSPEV